MKSQFTFTLLITLFLSIFFSDLSAQQDNSIFYLRNGSVYMGEVLSDEGDNLDVRLFDGNEIKFSKSTVKRYLDSKNIITHANGKYHATRGFFFHTALGMNLESLAKEEEDVRISSHMPFMFGWYLNSKIAVAAGFGFEFNEVEVSGFEFDTQFSSQFLYGRYYFNNKRRRPFAYARVGYGFSDEREELNQEQNGGFQFQGGAGLHFSSRKKSKFVLSLGYHLQKADGRERFIDQFGNEIIADYDVLLRRVMISFGIEFNKVPKRYRK